MLSERHNFASATETLLLAAAWRATGFVGAAAIGGFSIGTSTGAGFSVAAGTGAGAGAALVTGGCGSSRGAAVSMRGDEGATGPDGWRNPNHHVPLVMSSTAAIAIAIVGRLSDVDTGDAVRIAAVGGRGGGAGVRVSVASRSGGAGAGGSIARATGLGFDGGAVGTGAETGAGVGLSAAGRGSDTSNGLPVAAQKSRRFCPLV